MDFLGPDVLKNTLLTQQFLEFLAYHLSHCFEFTCKPLGLMFESKWALISQLLEYQLLRSHCLNTYNVFLNTVAEFFRTELPELS